MEMEICGNLMGHSNPNAATNLSWPNNTITNNNNNNNIIWELNSQQTHFLYASGEHNPTTHFHPDPHLMCLNLGKRHYFEDSNAPSLILGKRAKPPFYATTVPRCQVEGCHVALVNAKDYHRRHRVCEMHSKAPKVVVLGLDQRFCQQCSRFHVISEFDDSKRSCRRRLAGHNERRRKSSHESARNCTQAENKSMTNGIAYVPSPTGRALSLLSSKNESWANPSELSQRSSAALRELIAENRAAILARQLILDRDWQSNHGGTDDFGGGGGVGFQQQQQQQGLYCEQQHSWERMNENGGSHVTLDLMQAPSSAFGLLSVRGKSKEEDEECCELWNSFNDHDPHVV